MKVCLATNQRVVHFLCVTPVAHFLIFGGFTNGKINFDAISDMTVNERISAAIDRLSENDVQYDETSSRLIEYYSNIMMDELTQIRIKLKNCV